MQSLGQGRQLHLDDAPVGFGERRGGDRRLAVVDRDLAGDRAPLSAKTMTRYWIAVLCFAMILFGMPMVTLSARSNVVIGTTTDVPVAVPVSTSSVAPTGVSVGSATDTAAVP